MTSTSEKLRTEYTEGIAPTERMKAMFTTLRSFAVLIVFGLFSSSAEAAPFVLPEPQAVDVYTFHCITLPLAQEIVSAFKKSSTDGKSVLGSRMNEYTESGQPLCRIAEPDTIYISQIELVGSLTSVINSEDEVNTMVIAEVRLGSSPEKTAEAGFLIFHGKDISAIMGSMM